MVIYVLLFFQWLRKTNRKPLLEAVEKMKEGIWPLFSQPCYKSDFKNIISYYISHFLASISWPAASRIDAAWIYLSSFDGYLKHDSQYLHSVKVL